MEEEARPWRNPWFLLAIFGVILQCCALVANDLGLDAHVRLNARNDMNQTGQDLVWGNVRIGESLSSDDLAKAEYHGYIPPWYTSQTAVKISSLVCTLTLAFFAGVPLQWKTSQSFEWKYSALILLSPVMLFSSGRGYDESILALFVGGGVLVFVLTRVEAITNQWSQIIALASSLVLLLWWKGFSLGLCFVVWLFTMLLGGAWMYVDGKLSTSTEEPFTQHPWKMAGLGVVFAFIATISFGLFSQHSTLNVISVHPMKYLIALCFSFVDVVVLFLGIGFVLWPMFIRHRSALQKSRGHGITILAVFIACMLTSICMYIAALWTLESEMWGQTIWRTMIILGNNGRYATCLLIPLIVLLKWVEEQSEDRKIHFSFTFTFTLLLPLMLFISFYGQQLWSVDVGGELNEQWSVTDDEFVLISSSTLAMHQLYAMKTSLDLSGENEIVGYWCDETLAEQFLREHPAIDFIVVGPDVELHVDMSQWVLIEQQDVPASLSKPLQQGTWMLYRVPS